jgi:hypothetical protein
LTRLLLAAYFLEAGILLAVVPWSGAWDRNYLAVAAPALGQVAANFYVRGAVSGLGLLNVAAGVSELVSLVASRRS